jgi:membrane protein required for colicin V production
VSRLDAFLLGVLALFALRGLARGFFRECFGLAGVVAGVALAATWGPQLARTLLPLVPERQAAFVAAWAVCVLGAVVVAGLAGRIVERLARALFLGIPSRLGGAVVGSVKGAALLGVGLLAAERLVPSTTEAVAASRLGPPLTHFARRVLDAGRPLAPEREAA